MIIDAHTHVHPDADGLGDRYDARLENLLANLAASEVDKAVIYAEAVDVPYIKRIENDYVGACCAQHPDTLIGFASVHPLEPDPVKTFEEAVRRYGFKGLKLHPRFQGVAADDPRVAPLARKAAELGLPVAIDALLWKPTPLKLQLPINVDGLCKQVPEARIIMAHAGGFHFLDTLAVAVANPNVHLEISVALTFFHGTPFEDQFMFALKQLGPKRLIYGSDFPQKPMQASLDESRAILKKHGFSDADLEWILGKTFLSLLPGENA
ncbi:MAG TPA: amidohydrolase family protein [Candidatus Hydrogenedentes bacterium]|nr:amidohydrolase family protein [Candidatus Hydrogenedentota bacterium]